MLLEPEKIINTSFVERDYEAYGVPTRREVYLHNMDYALSELV